jgi:hypothetical protein
MQLPFVFFMYHLATATAAVGVQKGQRLRLASDRSLALRLLSGIIRVGVDESDDVRKSIN